LEGVPIWFGLLPPESFTLVNSFALLSNVYSALIASVTVATSEARLKMHQSSVDRVTVVRRQLIRQHTSEAQALGTHLFFN